MTTYTERQCLKYTPGQLFDLIVDVERYPELTPWIVDSRVRRRDDHVMNTELTVGAGASPQVILHGRSTGSTASSRHY
jgi:ribosome-associated toxin RatA of RatAB toxin-antitoxin module